MLALSTDSAVLVHAAAIALGLGWGGVPTLLQTAAGETGGEAADDVQAILVTLWNVAMAGGGFVCGLLPDAFGAASIPWTVLLLLAPVLATVLGASIQGFPAPRARKT